MKKPTKTVCVGVAGWALPEPQAGAFPDEGSHLARYAARFPVVEINSSFYRRHRPQTYERWAASVPAHFRFSVKLPREITHERKLADCDAALRTFLDQVTQLGEKLGPLLVQLPPSLQFESKIVRAFFKKFRTQFDGQIACEPRHATWLSDAADDLLVRFKVARVAADPARVARAAIPGGYAAFAYWRLHGSPRMYYSSYGDAALAGYARKMMRAKAPADQWCIFDNTAYGTAIGDAFALKAKLKR